MNLTDTHSHLYAKEFKDDLDESIQRCLDDGVERIFLPNIDLESIEPMLALEEAYPSNCFAMMGLHPCSVKENFEKDLSLIKDWLTKRDFAAIGEIGIDLYWDSSLLKQQQTAFIKQIEWAKELKKPIIIHTRNSFNEIFEILDDLNDDHLSGIFHCFSGNIEQATRAIDYGNFWLGIGGVLTFKNAGLDHVVKDIDLSRLVLETDSPYLAPTPYRGKRNESSYLKLIATKLAEVKNVSLEEIAQITTANSKKIFGR
ncbi:MAG: TatD family hydrolase [Crocinitomicaceae bacterium]|nr:TatD family hydrolase [Crocinitomicaceae bacterium]MBT5404184.1 TatD family hydrolase [Crocinitomicaceae bacterium]MBT6029763.1 TatD family hydrolase [Crocinitomicaceae bacterium]MBT6515823.1 TatD family hydrolase [Crocinitomicaceae bacterium]